MNGAGSFPKIPVFPAEQAVLYERGLPEALAELQVRRIMTSMGGSFDRLPVERQYALARYAMNSGSATRSGA